VFSLRRFPKSPFHHHAHRVALGDADLRPWHLRIVGIGAHLDIRQDVPFHDAGRQVELLDAADDRRPRALHPAGVHGRTLPAPDTPRRTGVPGYPGAGRQGWPAGHAADAATLFRLALEEAPGGSSWHAVADEGDAVSDIAAVIVARWLA